MVKEGGGGSRAPKDPLTNNSIVAHCWDAAHLPFFVVTVDVLVGTRKLNPGKGRCREKNIQGVLTNLG